MSVRDAVELEMLTRELKLLPWQRALRFVGAVLSLLLVACATPAPSPARDCGAASLIDQERLIRTDSGAPLVLPCPDAGK